MTDQITTSTAEKKTMIFLEGHLGVCELSDLRQEFRSAKTSLLLDLSGLLSADEEGMRLLRSLSDKGVELCGASAYLRLLLGFQGFNGDH